MTTESPNTGPSVTPAASEAAPQPSTPSLEQIASEFSVDERAQQFTATPQSPQPIPQPTTPPPFQQSVPDPVMDPEGYKRFVAQQSLMSSQLQTSLSTLNQRLEAFERQQVQAKVDADIQRAVTKVNEKLKVDPMLCEIALDKMYRTDANFKRIWDNREKNPAAFEKALDIVSQKLSPMFQVRQDPQLTENQRAAQASQRTMASTQKSDVPSGQEALYNASNAADFDKAWEAFKRGMG